jgi:hypothetical protein
VKTKPFLIGMVAAILGVIAYSIYLSVTIDRPDKSVVAVVSPNGKYKAVRVTFAAGGSKPFCFDIIAVFLTVYPDSFAESEKAYEVYRAPCAAPDKRAALPKTEWLSETAVQITYAPDAATAVTKQPLMKPIDASNFVHVSFVARE